mmetsp:Transcript_133142/g.323677  ORF Transcript_133142/g.323677 Transcript_133142/m.323677 type:complete len:100 (-) Transcript_133142:32-331(-)
MAIGTGYTERSDTSMVSLVGLDPVHAEQRTHDVQVAILARDEQRCDSIARPGLVGLDLGFLALLSSASADVTFSRKVDDDTTGKQKRDKRQNRFAPELP